MEKEQTLPGYLKQLRRLCHYRQDYVASQLNIARQTYSHYETGRIKPPAEALYKLAGIYGVPIGELLSHTAAGQSACVVSSDSMFQREQGAERQLLYWFRQLDERNRKDILSIMQVKIRNQDKGQDTDEREEQETCRA